MKHNIGSMPKAAAAAILLGAAGIAHGLTTEEWQAQSIYQVLTDRFATSDSNYNTACSDLGTFCGGTWTGILNNLDYIQNMNFTAVWISPIVKNIQTGTALGDAYHGFWAQDIYSLNDHFGTEADLLALSAEIHRRGMYLMVDVVTNHMAFSGSPDQCDYSLAQPFNSQSYYHDACVIDDNDANSVIVCWEGTTGVSLADLRTEDANVRQLWKDWIKDLVTKYSIDGLRLDTTKHVEKDFWEEFLAEAGVFGTGEILNGDPNTFPSWIADVPGFVNYPAYFWLTRAFASTSATMTELVNGVNEMKALMKTSTFSPFIENHDNPRFASLTQDISLAKNALAFTMLMDGIPIIYQGQEQWQEFTGAAAPYNREPLWTSGYNSSAELYGFIADLNKIRTLAIAQDPTAYVAYQANPIWNDDHTVVMKKADVITATTNVGSSGAGSSISLPSSSSGYVAGSVYVDLLSCETFTAATDGGLAFSLGSSPRVIYPQSKLASGNTGLCGY